MGLRVVSLWQLKAFRVRITVALHPDAGKVIAMAYRTGRRHPNRSFVRRAPRSGVVTLTAKLSPGSWTVVISAKPARGYATPPPRRIRITVLAAVRRPRLAHVSGGAAPHVSGGAALTTDLRSLPLQIGRAGVTPAYTNQSCFWQVFSVRSSTLMPCVR